MTRLRDRNDLWIRHFQADSDNDVRLVCFPHAGGSANFFWPLSEVLRREESGLSVDILGVQYAGRLDRHAEKPVTSIAEYRDRIASALAGWADLPMVFFGHSMGALIAFEVARKMRDDIRLAGLIASGRRAPSIGGHGLLHQQEDDVLVAELKELSGTDSRLLDNDDLLRIILPAVRADYRAVETYEYEPGPALTCPLTVFTGEEDPKVTIAEALAWRDHSANEFRLRAFPGGHFYLSDWQEEVARAVADEVRRFARS